MSHFNCSRCGGLVETPAPGDLATCAGCGQRFESPAVGQDEPARSRRREEGYDDEDRYDEAERHGGRRRTHSGLGVASFIIGVLVVVLDLLLLLLTVIVNANARPRFGGRDDTAYALTNFFGIFNCVGVIACLAGLGLGIGGLFQTDRKRGLAVAGVILNGLVVVAVAALVLIGLLVAGRLMR